ncbi:MAG: nucleoside phosphorylase [Erysipelotrichales bacterium]|nr:nucleoside phosphorylase [Erysipelotrichales bacterium]
MVLERSFVPDSEEILLPGMIYKPYETPLRTVIVTFSDETVKALRDARAIQPLWGLEIRSVSGTFLVYRVKDHPDIGVFQTIPGAAGTVAFLEEVAYRCKTENFVLYGSCGALDDNLTAGKVVVPTKALRDKGTSYHYQSSADWIDIPRSMDVARIFAEIGVPFVEGYTWTTDAIYRETKEEAARHKAEGCLVAEMEIAAVQAMCAFRGYHFFPFVYSADSLTGDVWEPRILGNLSVDERLHYFALALEIALRI